MKRVLVSTLIVIMGIAMSAFAGSVLRTTITATPEALDPAVVVGENDWKVVFNLYDFLVYPSFNDASPEAAVAASWDLSDDSLTWTFHLNKGIKFHDGSELTSEDVKFSMERMIEIGEGYAYFYKGRLAEVLTPDQHTVVFRLSEPFGPFLVTLYRFGILNKNLVMDNLDSEGMYGQFGDYGKTYLLDHDAGSGPYYAAEFKIRNYVKMAKFNDYWQGVPAEAPDEVIATQVREAATTKMMMGSGEIDLAHGRQELTTLNALLTTENVGVAYIREMSLNFFMINTKKPPTDDVHIRKAMAWATDYAGMIEIYPGSPRAYGPVPSHIFGAAKDLAGYETNIEKAREEIKKSKYYGNLDAYPIDVSYIQGNGDTPKLCMLFAVNMAAIGLKVNIVEAPWVLFCNKEESIETSPHVTNLFADASYPEAGAILELKYASWTVGGWNQNEWLQDETFDEGIRKSLVTADPQERAARYAELEHYIMDEVCPTIITFVSVLKTAYRADRFSWPAGDGNPHAIAEFNFNYRFFKML